MGKFKVVLDCEISNGVTLFMRKVPAPIILEQAVFQQNRLVEKRDGVLHIIKAPFGPTVTGGVAAPLERATIVSGMRILGPWLGIQYRCETNYCNEKVSRFIMREKLQPLAWFHAFLKNCGATYEIEKGVYVIKDGYWSVSKSSGGGSAASGR